MGVMDDVLGATGRPVFKRIPALTRIDISGVRHVHNEGRVLVLLPPNLSPNSHPYTMAVGSMRPDNNTYELPPHRFSSYFITHTPCFSLRMHYLGLQRENRQGKGEISLPLPERDSANDVCLW